MPININAGSVSSPAGRVVEITLPLSVISLVGTQINRALTGDGSPVVDRDALLDRVSNCTQVSDYQMLLTTFGGIYPAAVTWSSSDESKATVDTEGYVTFVSTGVVTITATVNGEPHTAELTMTSEDAADVDAVVGYVAGSLAKDATDAVDNRIAGKSPVTALRVYTTQEHGALTYERNLSCWCADLDLTCISPYNSVSGASLGLTAISPRHVIGAAHAMPPVGTIVRFVADDNSIVERAVTAVTRATGYAPTYPDYAIGLLSSDLPASISFAKVLPTNWINYLPSLSYVRTLPSLVLDKEEKAQVTDLGRIFDFGNIYAAFGTPNGINWEQRVLFYEEKVGGDSGNPAFLILGGELVLITVLSFAGAGTGTFLSNFISDINSIMTSLGGGYQLTTKDLSGYANY